MVLSHEIEIPCAFLNIEFIWQFGKLELVWLVFLMTNIFFIASEISETNFARIVIKNIIYVSFIASELVSTFFISFYDF